MNIVKWITVIVIAYIAGYFSRSPEPLVEPKVIADCLQLDAFKEVQSALLADQERTKRLEKTNATTHSSSASGSKREITAAQDAPIQSSQEKLKPAIATPEAATNPTLPSSATETNLSDEEIDRLVAAPFNESLKRVRGPLREKYKEFSETTQQGSWDVNMQNKITDALLGNSYSKFIEVQMVNCKANFCEIRGRELKQGVINLIFSEMSLQDWWDVGHSQWSNGGENHVFYGLLLKR